MKKISTFTAESAHPMKKGFTTKKENGIHHNENVNFQSHIQLIEDILNLTDPNIQTPTLRELGVLYKHSMKKSLAIDNILSVQEEIDKLKMQFARQTNDCYSNVSSDWDAPDDTRPSPSIQAPMEPQNRTKKAKRSRSHSRRSQRKKHYHKSRSRSRRRSTQHRTQHGKCESYDCDSLPPERKRSKHHSRTSRRSSKSYNRNHKRSQSRSHDRRKPHQNRHRNTDLHKSIEEYEDVSDTEYGSFDDQVGQLSSFDRHRELDFKKKNKRKRRDMSPSNRGYKKTMVDIYSSDSNASKDTKDSDDSGDEPKRTKKRDKLATRIAKSVLRKLSKASSKHKVPPLKRINDKMESNGRMLSENSTKKEPIKASTSKRITKTCTVSTEEWKDSFDIESSAEIDDEIIQKVVAESSVKKDDASTKKVVPNLSFDMDTVKQALATVKRNDRLYSECSPVAQPPNVDDQQYNPVVQPPNHQWAFAQSNCSQPNKDPRLQRLREQSEQGFHHQSPTQASFSHYLIRTPYSPIYEERFHPNESYMPSPSISGYEHASFSSMPYQNSIEFNSMPYQHPIQSHRVTSPTSSDYNKRFVKMREYVASRNNQFERQNYDHSKMARESSNAFIKRTETQMTYPGGHTGKQRNVPYTNYGEYRRSRQAIISSSTIAETVTCVNAYPLRSVYGNNTTSNSKMNFKVQESPRDVDASTEIQTKHYANASINSKLQESVDINEYGKNSTSMAKFNFKFPEKAKNIKFNEVDTTDDWDLETGDPESQNNSNIDENVNSFSKEKLEPQGSNEKSNNFNDAMVSSRSLNSNSSVRNTGGNNLTSTTKFNYKKSIELNEDTRDNWDSEAELDGGSDQNNSKIEENVNSFSEEKLEPQSYNQKSNNFNKAMVSPRSVNSTGSAGNSCGNNSTSTTKLNFKIPKVTIRKLKINKSDTTDNSDSEVNIATGSESKNNASIEENKENEESPVVTSSSISINSTLTDVQRKRDTIAKLKELFATPMSLDTLNTVKKAIEKLTKETDAEGIEGLVKAPKQNKQTKKRKNELDRLNEDIDASFIRDDVLNATGKRICSQNTNYDLGDSPEEETEHKIKTMDDFDIQKNKKKNTLLRARAYTTIFKAPLKQHRQPPIKELKSKASQIEKATTPTGRPNPPNFAIETSKKLDQPKENMKRSHPEVSHEQYYPKTAKIVAKVSIKNDNPECHSLNKISKCFLCDKTPGLSLVHHYVNFHPNDEVVVSRLAPDVADHLRRSENVMEYERIKRKGKKCYELRQFCHFCNVYKCFSRRMWINHIAKHTGYYQYECTVCAKKYGERCQYHSCGKTSLKQIPQPQFQNENLYAYICDICNFVRFTESEIETHISCQHGNFLDIGLFVKVMFLSLQKKKMKSDEESELEDYNPDNDVNSESDEYYKTESELDSDHEWEFDENYKKNLEKDYEEEQRQEFEEEDFLKEELEREATEPSSNELSEDEIEGNSMLKAEREGVIVKITIKPLESTAENIQEPSEPDETEENIEEIDGIGENSKELDETQEFEYESHVELEASKNIQGLPHVQPYERVSTQEGLSPQVGLSSQEESSTQDLETTPSSVVIVISDDDDDNVKMW